MSELNLAIPPEQSPAKRSNIPLIVGAVLIGLLAFIGVISLIVKSSVNGVVPFRELMASAQVECLKQIQSNQAAVNILGSPMFCPTQASGTIGHPVNGLVKAQLTIPVQGPKGAGKLIVVGHGGEQPWVFESILLQKNDGTIATNILVSK
jgi:hypothetical protein